MKTHRTFRFLVSSLPTAHTAVALPPQEAAHALQVLRLKDGDLVELFDGAGGWAQASLQIRGKKDVQVLLQKNLDPGPRSTRIPLRLELAVLKGEAMEWAIEKCTELGVSEVFPILTDHCVIQLREDRGKGPDAFSERWSKIADQALKQCERVHRLVIHPPRKLQDHLATVPLLSGETRLWCDEAQLGSRETLLGSRLLQLKPTSVRILIGPEGGFSVVEREGLRREKDTHPVSLGPWILRAETAALSAAALASQHLVQ